MGLDSSVDIVTVYGLNGPRIESGWGRDFPHLSRPTHSAYCTMGTGSFPGVKSGRSVKLTSHPLLALWSRKSRAIPLLLQWAVRPLQSLSSCTRVHFTFYLIVYLILRVGLIHSLVFSLRSRAGRNQSPVM